MSNINTATRRRQWVITGITLAVAAAIGTGVWWYRHHQEELKKPAPVKVDLTGHGLVTSNFTETVTNSVLTQQQNKTATLEKGLDTLSSAVSSQNEAMTRKLEQISSALEKLQNQADKPPSAGSGTGTQSSAGMPANGPLSKGPAGPAQWKVTDPANGPASGQGGQFYPSKERQGFYPGSGTVRPGGLKRDTFTYAALQKPKYTLPWIPSGSFSEATMIEGADANASVTGQQNTSPVVITLLGDVSMPNGRTYNMDKCRVTGEIYGDISSERGDVRTKNISCILKNGDHIDMPFEGHVSYQGKVGIRGKPVMRNGQILMNAGGAGFLSGLGDGFKSAATPMVGLGGATTIGAGDIFKQGLGGGASKAADTLSQYYIKRAEQYHPVIDIGAGNAVTVVFQQGFRLKTIEQEDAEKEKKESPANPVQQTAATTAANSPKGGSDSTVLNPDEVLRQASQLRLGDTIN